MFGFRLSVKCVAGVLLAALVASGASVAEAQTTHRTRRESNANRKARIQKTIEETYSHRYEVAGGGGYLRFQPGPELRKNNEVTFWMTGTYYLNPKLGIAADVHGAYGNAKIGNTPYDIPNPQISEYTFMGGPSYRVYAKEKVAAGVFAMAGAGLGKFSSGSKGIPSTLIGIWPAETRAAFQVGANFDYNFYPNIGFRITPIYVGTLFGGTLQNSLGFNIGILYRFGKIK